MKNFIFTTFVLFPLFVFSQNVGVGTTDPETTLHIQGTDPVLRLENMSDLLTEIEFGKTESGNFIPNGLIQSDAFFGENSSMSFLLGDAIVKGMRLGYHAPTPTQQNVLLNIINPSSSLSPHHTVGINFGNLHNETYSSIKHKFGKLEITSALDHIHLKSGFSGFTPAINLFLRNDVQSTIIDTMDNPFTINPPDLNSMFDVNGQIEGNSLMIRDGAQDGHFLQSNSDGKASWTAMTPMKILADEDNDTRIHVEQFADEDRIRFGVGDEEIVLIDNEGLELDGIFELYDEFTRHLLILGPRISIENSGNSVFLGQGAGIADDFSNNENTFIGFNAGETNTGFHNTHLGAYAGQITIAHDNNTFLGFGAGQAAASSENVLIGTNAGGGNNNSIGKNVMIGHLAGQNSGSAECVYIGHGVAKTSTAPGNTIIGYQAGSLNTTGGNNVMIGKQAGLTGSGPGNVMIGTGAGLVSGASSENNVFIGNGSGAQNNGQNNTYVGYFTGSGGSGSNNVFIGNEAGINELGSNLLIVQNDNLDAPLITGDFDIDSVNIKGDLKVGDAMGSKLYIGKTLVQSGGTNSLRFNAAVRPLIDVTYQLGGTNKRWTEVFAMNGTINTSDLRAKKNVESIDYGLKDIMMLRPVKFHWNEETEDKESHLGLIAQELNKVIPEVVEVPKNEEELLGVKYADLIPVLIKGMQEQQELIQKQQQQINFLLKQTKK